MNPAWLEWQQLDRWIPADRSLLLSFFRRG